MALALEIAEAIVQHEVSHHATRLEKLIMQAFPQPNAPGSVMVYVNQADRDRLQTVWQQSIESNNAVQLAIDLSLADGNCRIETRTERMLADWRHQLSEIRTQVLEVLRHAPVE